MRSGVYTRASAAIIFAVVCTIGPLAGCVSRNEAVVADVAPRSWRSVATMTYDNRDTLSQRMATLFLRHDHRTRSGKYAVEFRAPSGVAVIRDTFAIESPGGSVIKFMSKPVISVNWESPYRRRIRLPEEGEWFFTVTPLQEVRGVWSVGIDLSKPLEPQPSPIPQNLPTQDLPTQDLRIIDTIQLWVKINCVNLQRT